MVFNSDEYNKIVSFIQDTERYQGLFTELSNAVGRKVRVSLVLGRPDGSEIDRILNDVKFIKSVDGLSVVLIMTDPKGLQSTLVLPNIVKAECDLSYDSPRIGELKYHFDIHDSLLDSIDKDKNFKSKEEQMKFEEMHQFTARIFIKTK